MPLPGQSAQRQVEPGLVAEPAEPEAAAPEPSRGRSDGRGVRLRRRVQVPRSRRPEAGHRAGDDDVAGLVAGRLRALRAALHPDGVAQRGHLPHQGRPRRCRVRRAALRALEQLAGQREPRQGAAAAVAGQEEVRPEDLVGGPDGLRRQLRPRVHGVQDVRLRRRARGCLGAGADQLGDRGHVAGRRALQRRAAARQSSGRRADGPHLRESGRAQRHSGSRCRRDRHSGDVPPDGDERRGDRGAHCRRAYVRQDPRGGPGLLRGSRARSRRHRGAGPRLEEQLRHRQGRRRDWQRPGSHLDVHADQVEQQLLLQPVRVRMGADQEPGRCESVDREGRRRRRRDSGRLRPLQASRADHADHRPLAAPRSGLREDLETLLREPGPVGRRLRPGVVQADAPRHGAHLAVPRSARSQGAAVVAGPGPAGHPRADRSAGRSRPSRAGSSHRD